MNRYSFIAVLGALILAGLSLHAQKSVTISGTIIGSNESHIRNTGGDSIIVRLTGDKWVTGMGDNNDSTVTLIHSFAGFKWDSIANKLNHLNVNLYNDSTVGIGLPVVPGYDIYQNENYTLSIPVSILSSHTPIGSTASFTINYIPPTVIVSGSILDDNEDSIRLGRGKITLTLSDDEWEPVIGTNDNATRDLIQAITGSTSWNNYVIKGIVGSDKGDANVSLSGQVVTINIPAIPDYDISLNDNITIDIPENALVHTSSVLNNVGTFTIQAKTATATINDPGLTENNLNGAVIRISLLEETFDAGVTLAPAHFSVNGPPTTTISGVSKIDSVKADLTIAFTGDFDADFTSFNITALNSGLTGTANLTSQNITVTATAEPHIINVTVPNSPFKIGSVVPVTILVFNDGGSTYTYAGGMVAERTLDSLKRNSSTQYTGYFTVIEGSKEFPGDSVIRVQNLRLDNGSVEGDIYSGNIIQPNDIIDTHKPVITSFLAIGNSHRIGDKVRLVAIASETGCTVAASLSSINGITYSTPKMSMTNPPPTMNYYIDYLVEQGDNDVLTPGALTANLVLRDAGGNESVPIAVNTSNSVIIDAHKPVINTLFVPDIAYKIGDVVTLTINTDGSGYYVRNDSHVNNIYYSSGRFNFYVISPGVYRISYTVLGTDPEINPGNMTARIIMNDEAGNSSDPKTVIEPNTAAVYTLLPSASISGDATICSGDSAKLFINLTGRKPWKVTVSNGSTDQLFTDINSSPFSYYVKPSTNTNYTIKSVYDANNQLGNSSDTAHITVNQKSPVHITGLESYYFYRTDSIEIVQLTADSAGGVFSGPGVVSATSEFYPSIAGLAEINPHVIRYDYTNRFGCKSYDTANVFVIEAIGVLNFSRPLKGNDDVLCFNESPVDLTAVIGGSDPVSATFFILFKEDQFFSILAQNTQTTSINPAVLSHGIYRVDFYYLTRTWLRISRKFMIEEVKAPEFIGLDINEICSNDSEIALQGTDPDGVFSGTGVNLNVSGKYYFNPGIVTPDNNYTITYTSSTPAGCQNSSVKIIRVNLMPVIKFGVADTCLSYQELVVFNNTSTDKSRISEWLWDFGDINSGTLNYDTSMVGSHIFTTPVSGTVKLSGTTYEGCKSTYSRIVGLSDTPIGRFSVENECFVPGSAVTIDSKGSTSIRPISNYEWKVEFSSDSTENYYGPALNKINIQFPSVSIYPVELILTTDLGCKSDPFKDTIVLRPTIVINQDAPYYEETFDDWGSWAPQSMEYDKPHRWLHQLSPDFLRETPDDRSWNVVLNGDSSLVKSAIVSPCFDLSGMKRPMIKMDIYRSFFSENLEGAALQYTIGGDSIWLPVGKLEDGINWYNSYLINNLPQVIGWTGNPQTKDSAWVEARHGLDILAGIPNVQFRIAFVSNNYQPTSRFAFDNIRIAEKSRLSLLEHFTNTGTLKPSKDAEVNSIYSTAYHDFLKLEYHTSFPSVSDPFNLFDKAVPGARVYYYGINSIPYAILDGGTDLSRRFDFSQASLSLNEDDISVSTLFDPKVDIKITPTLNGSDLNVKVNLKAKSDLPKDEKILFVVIYEKTAAHSGTNYYNVVKTFLPDAGGTAIYQAWHASSGDTTRLEYNFTRNISEMNLSTLRVAAFLQNDLTGEVYQAVTSDTSGIIVGFNHDSELIHEWKMFPNPAHEFVNFVFGGEIIKGIRLQIFDQLGIKIFEEEVKHYEDFKTINLNHFREGFYYVRLSINGKLQSEVKKLIIMK